MMHTPTLQSPATAALIVGCGYLGRRLAPHLIPRHGTVFGSVRSQASAARLPDLGVRPLLLQVTQPLTYASLTPALKAESLDVYYMVPPGRPGGSGGSPTPRQTVLGGIAHAVKQLRRASVRRAVLVSSSAVYGNTDGARVDADTTPKPHSERGQLLLEGERLWLGEGEGFHVVRLAGIYGPGRVIGLKQVHEKSPLLGNPDAMLNLIHADDAVALLLAVMDADAPGRIELGCDGSPVPRIDYYRHLAELLGAPPPVVMSDAEAAETFGANAERLRRSSNKALDNIPTCRRTGWSPRFPTFRQGVEESLKSAERLKDEG